MHNVSLSLGYETGAYPDFSCDRLSEIGNGANFSLVQHCNRYEIGNSANFALVQHCNPYNNVSLISSEKLCSTMAVNRFFLGRHVWSCWLLWEPWWHYIRPRVQIPDRKSPPSLLDYEGDFYCTRCFGDSYLRG